MRLLYVVCCIRHTEQRVKCRRGANCTPRPSSLPMGLARASRLTDHSLEGLSFHRDIDGRPDGADIRQVGTVRVSRSAVYGYAKGGVLLDAVDGVGIPGRHLGVGMPEHGLHLAEVCAVLEGQGRCHVSERVRASLDAGTGEVAPAEGLHGPP